MSCNFTELQIKEARRAFRLFDKDNDGYITKAELEEMFFSLGITVTQDELRDILKEIDTDGSETIEFDEFIAMMGKRLRENDSEFNTVEVFRTLDRDCDGFVSREELEHANRVLGGALTEGDIDEVMDQSEQCQGMAYDDFVRFLNPS